MLIQDYSASNLKKVISRKDVRGWDLWSNSAEMNRELSRFERTILQNGFTIRTPERGSHNGFETFQPSRSVDHVAFKLVDHYIRRIYRVKQSDRSRIIREIRALIEDSGSLSIIRKDVKSFYDSISFENIIKKIEDDLILSEKGLSILKSLREQLSSYGYNGLPRGTNLSATLSELYVEPIDKYMQAQSDVFYYARYVDDIFILTEENATGSVCEKLGQKLTDIGLELHTNSSKSLCQSTHNANFTYLGYQFKTRVNSNRKPFVDVSIAPEKVKKVKRRIIMSFIAFQRQRSFDDLLDRLRYLSCNKVVKRSANGNVLSGLCYNYCEVTDIKYFKVFDGFLSEILRNNPRLSSGLSPAQIQRIKRISFYRAAQNRIVATYTRRKVEYLKLAWLHD